MRTRRVINCTPSHTTSWPLAGCILTVCTSKHLSLHHDKEIVARYKQCTLTCVTSGFHRDADDVWALLQYYAALSGSPVPTFRENLSVPPLRIKKCKEDVYTLTACVVEFSKGKPHTETWHMAHGTEPQELNGLQQGVFYIHENRVPILHIIQRPKLEGNHEKKNTILKQNTILTHERYIHNN
jgi:hypothetical protein